MLPEFLTNPKPEVYLSDNYVVLDFETTTVGKGLAIYPDNRIVSVAWRCGPEHPSRLERGRDGDAPVYYRRAGEFRLGELVRAIEQADFLVAHNSKFELG